jgi:hypothetical protein
MTPPEHRQRNMLSLLAEANLMWYSLPLIVAISLVYSATRHEEMPDILRHSLRLGIMITGFMAAILAALAILGYWL